MDIMEICEYYEYALQRSRLLQEFISELQAAWNDAAARAIQIRVLDPHKDDSERMLKAFEEQCSAFQQIQLKLLHIEEHEQEAHHLDEKMRSSQDYAQRELHEAEYRYDQFLHYDSIVRSQLPEIYRYIESAKKHV